MRGGMEGVGGGDLGGTGRSKEKGKVMQLYFDLNV